jgi:hypothetical protein
VAPGALAVFGTRRKSTAASLLEITHFFSSAITRVTPQTSPGAAGDRTLRPPFLGAGAGHATIASGACKHDG